MPQFDVQRLKQRAGGVFAGFTRGQKAMMAVAVVGVLAGLMLFARNGGESQMAALYSNLSASDASAITDELSSQGVPYRLDNGGSTVLVPAGRVYDLRLSMVGKGLPATQGYAILDDNSLGTSTFEQKVDYQRAIEGELAQTIQAFDVVEAATVHLVIPPDVAFAQDDRRATGSVQVQTVGDRVLNAMQVQSIVNLVASSVKGLSPDDVTLTDRQGRMYHAPGMDGAAGAAADLQSSQKDAFEADLADRIRGTLEAITGPGRVRVQVSSTIDFDAKATTTKRFTPPAVPAGNPALAASETGVTETFTGAGDAGGGDALGPDGQPNTGDETAAVPDNYQRTETERVYAVDEVTEEIRNAPGDVTTLSVAVLVDSTVVDAATVTAIEEIVTAAAGITPARGDVLEVSAVEFDTTAAEAAQAELDAAKAAESKQAGNDMIRTIAAVAVVVLILLAAWRNVRKAAKRAQRVEARAVDLTDLEALQAKLAELGPATTALGAGEDDALALAAGSLDEEGQLRPVEQSPEDRARQLVEDEVADLIDKQPEEVARLLRGWLAERRTAKR